MEEYDGVINEVGVEVSNVQVTLDGAWNNRSLKSNLSRSNNCVVGAFDTKTRLPIDVRFYSTYCSKCVYSLKENNTTTHQGPCCRNYFGNIIFIIFYN